MKIKILGSGSKGNSTFIQTKKLNILIDAGLSMQRINDEVQDKKIDIVMITHAHIDHTKNLNGCLKKYKPILYTQNKEVLEKYKYENVIISDTYESEEITIKLLNLSHDSECSGIIIEEKTKELVYITDTGYINRKILKQIKNKEAYIIESNHDVNMLRNSKYPFFLQQRILGDKGHLSNEDCSKYLSKIIGEKTKNIVLAHLSEKNNTKDLVLEQIKEKGINKKVNNIFVAKQSESLKEINL
jgi:phosphoribosyl 1,2-cyclic phosphodiesterase